MNDYVGPDTIIVPLYDVPTQEQLEQGCIKRRVTLAELKQELKGYKPEYTNLDQLSETLPNESSIKLAGGHDVK